MKRYYLIPAVTITLLVVTWTISSEIVDDEEEDAEDGGLDGGRNDFDQRHKQNREPRFG